MSSRWLDGKESAYQAGDMGDVRSIRGMGRSSGEGNGNPLWYSCLGNPMDRGVWWATSVGLHRVGHDLGLKQQQQQRTTDPIISINQGMTRKGQGNHQETNEIKQPKQEI